MQVPPPDLGEHTLFGRFGLWLLGLVVMVIGFAVRRYEKFGDQTDAKFAAVDRALAEKVNAVDHAGVDREVRRLSQALDQMRVDHANSHGELLNEITLNKNELQATISQNKDELKDALHKQTLELTTAIHALSARTRSTGG